MKLQEELQAKLTAHRERLEMTMGAGFAASTDLPHLMVWREVRLS